MHSPSTPVLATTVLAAAGSFSAAQAQSEFRGTRLPNTSVIRVLPSTTTNARPQVSASTPVATRSQAARSGLSAPMVSPGVVSSNAQQRIAAARQRSSPRGSVAAAHPVRRIVITSANSSPVLRDPANANAPQRVPSPAAALAREHAPRPSNERMAPNMGGSQGRPTGGPDTPTPRTQQPDGSGAYGPQSLREAASPDHHVSGSSEHWRERLAGEARMVTRLHAATTPQQAGQIRVERTQVPAHRSVASAR